MIPIPLMPHDIAGRNTSSWLRRHIGGIVFLLAFLLLVVALAGARWYLGFSLPNWLGTQHQAMSALNSIVTMTLLVAGSGFSYYRFFKGRTLSLRSELTLDVTVHEAPEQYRLHAVTLTAKNVGTSTMWNPAAAITVRIHGPAGAEETCQIQDWLEAKEGDKKTVSVMDPGETIHFFAHQQVPVTAWAVTYLASLRAEQGDTWHVGKTVTNRERASKDGGDNG